jgi:thiol-disulfide isomerase/thioredoxin
MSRFSPRFKPTAGHSMRARGTILFGALAVTVSSFDLSCFAQEEPAKTPSVETTARDSGEFLKVELMRLLKAKKFDQAMAVLDAAIEEAPNDSKLPPLELSVALALRTDNPKLMVERLTKMSERLLKLDTIDEETASHLVKVTYDRLTGDQNLTNDEGLEIVEVVLRKLETMNQPTLAGALRRLTGFKVQLLIDQNRIDEAKELLQKSLEESKSNLTETSKTSIRDYLDEAERYITFLRSKRPVEVDTVLQESNNTAESLIRRSDLETRDLSSYYSFKSAIISVKLREGEPEKAKEFLKQATAAFREVEHQLDESGTKQLASYRNALSISLLRIESKLVHARLIGKPVPEFDAEYFIATDITSLDKLKGKVVLLDFWAVWCGPCIATFPKLTELHEKYSDRGLVVLGLTKLQNYRWDDTLGRPVRAEQGEEVSVDDELAMLRNFHQSHKLKHGFVVSRRNSDYSKKLGAVALPQVVLVDQAGNVQLIRTGANGEAADEIEAKIEELLESNSE